MATPNNQALRDAGAVYAQKEIAETFDKSAIEDKSNRFPRFDRDELTFGKLLGKGGFGSVYEVRHFDASQSLGRKQSKSKSRADPEVEEGEMEDRMFISDHCLRNNSDCRYAVKFLSQEIIDDPSIYIQGIMDMAIETRILSFINHPNIIKMRAMGKVSPYHERYIIVMDRLYDTLEKRINKWKTESDRYQGCWGKLLDGSGAKAKAIFEEKVVTAFDLAAALDYLHGLGILYRDLKPENIGFDIRNDVKLFDFGLAKELSDTDRVKDNLYNLTGMTGSPRYMAPEVAREEPYNKSCDVYSFSILVWQMMSMQTPFEVYTTRKFAATVWNEPHKRPFMDDTWPLSLKVMIQRGWSANWKERLTFGQITSILRTECIRIRDGDASGLEHTRRRSTFVFSSALSRKALANGHKLDSSTSSRKAPAPMLNAEDLEGCNYDEDENNGDKDDSMSRRSKTSNMSGP